MSDLEIRQRDRHVLRQGYSAAVRRFEIASIIVYAVTMAWLLSEIIPRIVRSPRTRMLLQTESICLGRSCDKFERRAIQPSGPLKALSL